MIRLDLLCPGFALLLGAATALPAQARPASTNNVAVLGDFPVVEFRRYTIKPGMRVQFGRYFETLFPEAFQQLGSIAAGSFLVRGDSTGFTWIRGYHTIESRAVINAAFYYGPVWREHKATLNALIDDSDNVLLMRALAVDQAVTILPAVDPVTEPKGAQGIVVAVLCTLKAGITDSFARAAALVFEKYRAAGARPAGTLVTVDVTNNFPQLPVRTDGPYLLWLGVLKDEAALASFRKVADQSMSALQATGMTRLAPELIVLDPTPRSRLRWLDN
ncbi:MAG: NIPSNAP family protein [Gemmatimonadota bacterium]